MNSHIHDPRILIPAYYADEIYEQFVPEQVEAAAENSKTRRRRKKNKGDEEGGALRKRKLSEVQVNMLEQSFESDHKLDSERKEKLAAELRLDPRQVAVWFQNRRARWKSKKLEEEYSKLKSQHDTTLLDKCRLQTELRKRQEQLSNVEKEIKRLNDLLDGFASNSPTSSFSLDYPTFLGEFGMEGLENVPYVADQINYGLDYWTNYLNYI